MSFQRGHFLACRRRPGVDRAVVVPRVQIDIRVVQQRLARDVPRVGDQVVAVEALDVSRHLGQPGRRGAVHFVAELPRENRLVVAVRHAGDGVGAGQHVAERGLVILLDLRIGVELGPLLAAVGGVGADPAQVIAGFGGQVEDHTHAVLVGQRQQMVDGQERLFVELAGAEHVMPGLRFLVRLADRQVPGADDAEVHLVERLEAVLLFPRPGQIHPLRQKQRPVVRQHQPRHVGADEAELLVAVHQLVALAGDEVLETAGRRLGGPNCSRQCQQQGDEDCGNVFHGVSLLSQVVS